MVITILCQFYSMVCWMAWMAGRKTGTEDGTDRRLWKAGTDGGNGRGTGLPLADAPGCHRRGERTIRTRANRVDRSAEATPLSRLAASVALMMPAEPATCRYAWPR